MADKYNVITPDLGQANAVILTDEQRKLLSEDLIKMIYPRSVFYQAATIRQDFEAGQAGRIEFTVLGELDKGAKLTEGVPIETKAVTSSKKYLDVYEWGNAIKVSELAIRKTPWKVLKENNLLLADDARLTLDTSFRDVISGTSNVSYAPLNTDVTSVPGSYAEFTTAHTFSDDYIDYLGEMMENLKAIPFVDPVSGEEYFLMFAHQHQVRAMKRIFDDASNKIFTPVKQYGISRGIRRGEVGMIDRFRVIETRLSLNGYSTANQYAEDETLLGGGTGTLPLYEAYLVGRNGLGFAESVSPEIRIGGIEDFGRMRSVAWYGIWGSGLINENCVAKVVTA